MGDLPEDVVEQILVRLPVRSVLRAAAVCKVWLSITSRKSFRSAHVRRSAGGGSPLHDPPGFVFERSLQYLSSDNTVLVTPRKLPPDYVDVLLHTCSGLLLASRFSPQGGNTLAVINPATGECKEIPRLSRDSQAFHFYAIACSPSSASYRVVTPVGRRSKLDDGVTPVQFQLYSSETGKWALSTCKMPAVRFAMRGDRSDMKFCLNGVLHWTVSLDELLCFDAEVGRAWMAPLPPGGEGVGGREHVVLHLGESAGRILLIEGLYKEVWSPDLELLQVHRMAPDYSGWSLLYKVNAEATTLGHWLDRRLCMNPVASFVLRRSNGGCCGGAGVGGGDVFHFLCDTSVVVSFDFERELVTLHGFSLAYLQSRVLQFTPSLMLP